MNRIAWSDDEDTGDSDDGSAAKKPKKNGAINESKIFQVRNIFYFLNWSFFEFCFVFRELSEISCPKLVLMFRL